MTKGKQNSNSTKAKKKQMKKKQQKLFRQKRKQTQVEDNTGTSLWVRNFVAIANSFPNFGKGLCWTFGSFIFLAFVFFILMGDIGSKELIGLARDYIKHKL
jgi:membrane protein YqaA with SNARE-associated domain